MTHPPRKPDHTPAALRRLLAEEPDLVDRIFEYVLDLMPELGRGEKRLEEAKAAVRAEFSGEETYIRKRSRSELAQEVLSQFNGRNATEVARRLRISRATVYRFLTQAGKR